MTDEKMTPSELLDWYCRRGVRVTTDGVQLLLEADGLLPSDIETARERKEELLEECKERDFELRAVWKRYNRTLQRCRDAEARLSTPGVASSVVEAFEVILGSISMLLDRIDKAGYVPSRDEILNGFAIPVEA